MCQEPAELETRIARCERAIFGDDDSAEGLSARMHMTETTLAKIDSTLSRLNFMILAAILVGILNVLMPRGGHAPTSNQSTSVITSDAAPAAADAAKAESAAQTRGYYLTADIARLWGKSSRTIADWIKAGRFEPAPVQHDREWRFDLDVRETTTQTAAAISRPPPLSAANGCDPEPQ